MLRDDRTSFSAILMPLFTGLYFLQEILRTLMRTTSYSL